jgi:hypothetical protein
MGRRPVLPPSLRPPREPREIGRHGSFLGSQPRQPPTLIGKPGPIAGVVHVRQPQHNRPQPPRALGAAVASDPIAGRCAGFHALHVTQRPGTFKRRRAGAVRVRPAMRTTVGRAPSGHERAGSYHRLPAASGSRHRTFDSRHMTSRARFMRAMAKSGPPCVRKSTKAIIAQTSGLIGTV